MLIQSHGTNEPAALISPWPLVGYKKEPQCKGIGHGCRYGPNVTVRVRCVAKSSLCPKVSFQALKASDFHSLLTEGLVLEAHFHREM